MSSMSDRGVFTVAIKETEGTVDVWFDIATRRYVNNSNANITYPRDVVVFPATLRDSTVVSVWYDPEEERYMDNDIPEVSYSVQEIYLTPKVVS